jgi:Flp pilus assembly protein TadB
MRIIYFLSAALLIYGIMLALNISFADFALWIGELVSSRRKNLSLQDRIKAAEKKQSRNALKRTLSEAVLVLHLTHRASSYKFVVGLAVILGGLGIVIAIGIGNYFLAPVLGTGLFLVPWWYIIYSKTAYLKNLNSELETTLSVVTNSYVRTENIIYSVEEHIASFGGDVKPVFERFLTEAKLLTADTKAALLRIKYNLGNNIFEEWIDALVACQDDKTLKATLNPIVAKLSDVRVLTAEQEQILHEPMTEFIMMTVLTLVNFGIIRLINAEWFSYLYTTLPGQITVAICFAAIFLSASAVIKLTRPIEYKR